MPNVSDRFAEYSYDAVGNRIQQTNGNGTSTEYVFDSDPRYKVASITHKRGANVLAQIGYPSRDSVGNPLGMTDWTGTWSYDYDSNNRLVDAVPPNPVPGQPAGGDYVYDWVGNRLRPPYGTGNEMVYNKADQLIRWPGMHTYAYDGAGNLTQVKNDLDTQVLKSYTYTPAGLLATGTFRDKDGNTRTLSNNWDADSNRVGMNANGTAYAFVYDTTAGIPAVLEESTLGSTAHYIREPGGALIARLNATNGTRYYHFDELGSTRLLTDADGDITDRYTYDAYGALLSHDRFDGSVNQPYQYVGQLGYYTHWMEPDFGLLQLGVRFYDPEVGRFTQIDPLAVYGISDALYADGNPMLSSDPSGMKCRKYHKSPTVEKCWALLDKCVGSYPFYSRAKRRLNDDILMCDGDGSFLPRVPIVGRGETNADTGCWKKGGDWHCQIRFFNDSVFEKGNDFCKTMLHELLHVGNWPRSDGRADQKDQIANATEYLWSYLCDKKSPCYQGKHPSDWGNIVDPWVK